MISLETSDNIQKFDALTYTTKNFFSYEYIMGMLPNAASIHSNFLFLDNEIYSVNKMINLLKTKNIFENDPVNIAKFNKGIVNINSNFDHLCNNLSAVNVSQKQYFDQWINKYKLDEVSEFNTLFETVDNKLDELNSLLNTISASASVISLVSKNALLYTKLLPVIRHLESIPNQPEYLVANSYQYVVNDMFFYPIVNELVELDTMNSSMDKIYYLFDSVKNNIKILVDDNPSIFSSKFNTNLKKLTEFGRSASDFFDDCREQLISQFKEFKGDEALPFAELYKNEATNNSIVDFLSDKKNNDDIIEFTLNFSENDTISKLIVFKDKTIGYVQKETYYSVPLGDVAKLHELRASVIESLITYELRKKPTIRNLFLNKFKEDHSSSEQVVLTLNNYIANEQVLKNLKVNLDIFENKSFENIDDAISSYIKYYKADKNIKNILGNKYLHLYDENKENILSISAELFDLDVNQKVLQDFIGKKIAAIHDGDELFNALKKFKNSLDEFDKDSLFTKLNMLNIKPLEIEPDVFVFEIKDYAACKALGSASWCIVRDEYYFKDYTSDSDRQYFVYDLNKDSSDIESMVGFTLHKNGSFRAKHYKNDDAISESTLLNKAQISILANDSSYQLTPKLKEKLDNYVSTTPSIKSTIKNTI